VCPAEAVLILCRALFSRSHPGDNKTSLLFSPAQTRAPLFSPRVPWASFTPCGKGLIPAVRGPNEWGEGFPHSSGTFPQSGEACTCSFGTPPQQGERALPAHLGRFCLAKRFPKGVIPRPGPASNAESSRGALRTESGRGEAGPGLPRRGRVRHEASGECRETSRGGIQSFGGHRGAFCGRARRAAGRSPVAGDRLQGWGSRLWDWGNRVSSWGERPRRWGKRLRCWGGRLPRWGNGPAGWGNRPRRKGGRTRRSGRRSARWGCRLQFSMPWRGMASSPAALLLYVAGCASASVTGPFSNFCYTPPLAGRLLSGCEEKQHVDSIGPRDYAGL
jgi:hypothetical protein